MDKPWVRAIFDRAEENKKQSRFKLGFDLEIRDEKIHVKMENIEDRQKRIRDEDNV